jgi:hypothetical protein
MFNVHTELPSGAVSRGYDRTDEVAAINTLARMVQQCHEMKNYTIDVVLTENGVEIQRERIHNAS